MTRWGAAVAVDTEVPPGRVAASGAVVALLAAAACWFASQAVTGWAVLRGPAPWEVATAVVAVAATGAAAVAAWLALGALVSTLGLLRGRPGRPAMVPAVVHRATALLLGVSLAAGATASAAPGAAPQGARPASAAGSVAAGLDPAWAAAAATDAPTDLPSDAATDTPADASAAPDPGWRPAAPATPPRTVAQPIDPVLLAGQHQPPDPRHLVTVRRGDTLWDLAARTLGPGAADAEIAAEWPRWYAANREVIGPDPDLLLPGQQLVPPDG